MEDLIKIIENKIAASQSTTKKLQEVYKILTEESEPKTIATDMNVSNGNVGMVKSSLNANRNNISSMDFTDYNPNESFEWKAKYFATKLNRAFSCMEFKEWIVPLEGHERAMLTLTHNISAEFKKLLKRGFIGAKFGGSNRHSFYLLKAWRTEDASDIKPEHYPPEEAFGNLAIEKRNAASIVWLTK